MDAVQGTHGSNWRGVVGFEWSIRRGRYSRWKFQAGGLQGEFGNCLCLIWPAESLCKAGDIMVDQNIDAN